MIKDFRDFVLKSDFVALATGLIVGGAVGAVVTSMVNDIIMPIPAALTKGAKGFADLKLTIPGADATIRYGSFIQALISSLIILLVVFIVIRAVQRLRGETEKVEDKECPFCATEIPIRATRCPHCTSHLPGAEEVVTGRGPE